MCVCECVSRGCVCVFVCVVEIDAEQITLPAVEDSGRRPKSGLLFWNTHTRCQSWRRAGAWAAVCVCVWASL